MAGRLTIYTGLLLIAAAQASTCAAVGRVGDEIHAARLECGRK
jgi:hypothetical protein